MRGVIFGRLKRHHLPCCQIFLQLFNFPSSPSVQVSWFRPSRERNLIHPLEASLFCSRYAVQVTALWEWMSYFFLVSSVHSIGHLELQVSDLKVHTARWVHRTNSQLKIALLTVEIKPVEASLYFQFSKRNRSCISKFINEVLTRYYLLQPKGPVWHEEKHYAGRYIVYFSPMHSGILRHLLYVCCIRTDLEAYVMSWASHFLII